MNYIDHSERRRDFADIVEYLRSILGGDMESARAAVESIPPQRVIAVLTELAADLVWEVHRRDSDPETFERLVMELNLFRPGREFLEDIAFNLQTEQNTFDRVGAYYPWLRAAGLGDWEEAERRVQESEAENPPFDE